MSNQDEVGKPEVEVMMKVRPDGKQVVLTFDSPDPFTIASFIMELETYLHEISTASDQKNRCQSPSN